MACPPSVLRRPRTTRRVLLALGVILVLRFFLGIPRARARLRRGARGRGDGELSAGPARLRRVAALLLHPGCRRDATSSSCRQHELADFPRLASFLARDRFIPRQFANRGDRLAFSNGIIILALLSIGLRGGLPGQHPCVCPSTRSACSSPSRSRRPAWCATGSGHRGPAGRSVPSSTGRARSPPASSR